MKKTTKMISCECKKCQNACKFKPGWFEPSQVKAVLKHFKAKTIKDLLGKDKLAIDWWLGDPAILTLSPNIKGNNSIQFPGNPKGECVFYKKGRCSIYDIRPIECRIYDHREKEKDTHYKTGKKWENRDELKEFYGKIDTAGYFSSFF